MAKCYILATLDDAYYTCHYDLNDTVVLLRSPTRDSPRQVRQLVVATLMILRGKLVEFINKHLVKIVFWLDNEVFVLLKSFI